MAPSSSLVARLKVQLKLSISRLRMTQQKDSALAKQQRRAMAQLLEQGKTESARIRVENIIRSDIATELHETLELYCELLLARSQLLDNSAHECDPGLEEAVRSIIYAAPRTEIKELLQVRQLFLEKFGKDFGVTAMEGAGVAERVLAKLRVETPESTLVDAYLREIAKTYGVPWQKGADEDGDGQEEEGDDDDNPSGGQAIRSLEAPLTTEELSRATPPRDIGPTSPVRIAPPSPSTDNLNPKVKLPGPVTLKPNSKMKKASAPEPKAGKAEGPGGKIPDVDELAKRFAELKR